MLVYGVAQYDCELSYSSLLVVCEYVKMVVDYATKSFKGPYEYKEHAQTFRICIR
jgi:hypothetical protein